jgi:hypothetical protein
VSSKRQAVSLEKRKTRDDRWLLENTLKNSYSGLAFGSLS